MDRLVSVGEVCEELGCSRKFVYSQVHLGRLPRPIKLGRSSRWKRSEIDRFIAGLSRRLDRPKR